MSKFTVRAPNGRSVNIKCDLGRFEFMHDEVLTQGSPHDVAKLAGIFPTIFIEKAEAAPAPVVQEPLSHPSDADPKFVVTEGQPVATGTDAVAGKEIGDMTDDELAAAAQAIAQANCGSISDAGLVNATQSLRSEEKPDELDPEKVAAKLMSIGAAKTAAAAQPTLLNNEEAAVEALVETAVESIAKQEEVPPLPVKEKKQEKPVKKEEKKTATPVAKGKIKKK